MSQGAFTLCIVLGSAIVVGSIVLWIFDAHKTAAAMLTRNKAMRDHYSNKYGDAPDDGRE
jgi:hypothetical protein